MRAKPIHAIVALCLLAFSICAFAQHPAKVGDLLDKGGKKMSKEDLAKLLPGATLKGVSTGNPEFRTETNFKGDGSLSGVAFRIYGPGTGSYSGKWSLSDQGQLCSDTTNSSNQRSQTCGFLFNLGSAYYTATTDDRGATLLEREVIR